MPPASPAQSRIDWPKKGITCHLVSQRDLLDTESVSELVESIRVQHGHIGGLLHPLLLAAREQDFDARLMAELRTLLLAQNS